MQQGGGIRRRTAPVRRVPAFRALLAQTSSFLLIFIFLRPFCAQAGIEPGVIGWALLQGCLAAALSAWFGLAFWWWGIQLAFPPAAFALHAQGLPPWLFLVIFLILAGVFWSTFRTQVPYYPSGRAAWLAVKDQLPRGRPVRFIDIGSGLGGLSLFLDRERPESSFEGIELAPLPWLISWIRSSVNGGRVRFRRGDYGNLSLAEYDVVFAYLSPAAMPDLWRKAHAEMRAGSLLLSYEFPIPGIPPHGTIQPVQGGPFLHIWKI